MQDAAFDEAKKVCIRRLLHTHSHRDAAVAPQHDPSLLGEAGSVLKDLLVFLKARDPRHYEVMVELVIHPTAEEDDA
jgi:hypothetical protein